MTYFFDTTEVVNGHNVQHKGRVYNIVDAKGNHKWFSVEQKTTCNGEVLSESAFVDFQQGNFLGIPQSDIDRAIKRRSK